MKLPVVILFAVLVAGCGSVPIEENPIVEANKSFLKQSDNYLRSYLAFKPVYASTIGYHHFDGELPDYSPKSIEAELVRIEGFRQALANLPAGDLDSYNLTDWEILENSMIAWKRRLTDKPDFKRDPLFYNNIVIKGLETLLCGDHAPATIRMEALLLRLKKIPEFLDIARVNLTETPEILRAAAEKPLVNTMYMLRNNLPGRVKAHLDGDLPEGFDEAHLNAIYSYTDFVLLFVKDELKKKTIKSPIIGEELYFKLWKNEEILNISNNDIDSILEFCKSNRDSVIESMKAAAKLIDPKKDLSWVLSNIESKEITLKDITDSANRTVGDLKLFIKDKNLVSIPYAFDQTVKVIEPDPRMQSIITSMTPGVLAKDLPIKGSFSINPLPSDYSNSDKYDTLRFYTPYTIALLCAGASYPGNHVQALKTRNSRSMVRKTYESATAKKGWAHYCRDLIMEYGFDPRPEAFLAQLKLSLLEINRLEAAARIHCGKISLNEAEKFLIESSFITPTMAHNEIVRIVRDPKTGAGAIGKAQIIKLRNLYMDGSSSKSIKVFHDLFLSDGPVPTPIIASTVFGLKI